MDRSSPRVSHIVVINGNERRRSLRTHLQQAKVNAKAKKIKEQTKEIKEKFKHEINFLLSLSRSLGVNGP